MGAGGVGGRRRPLSEMLPLKMEAWLMTGGLWREELCRSLYLRRRKGMGASSWQTVSRPRGRQKKASAASGEGVVAAAGLRPL